MAAKHIKGGYEIKIYRQQRSSLLMKSHPGYIAVYIPLWMTPESPEVVKFIDEAFAQIADRLLPPREQILTPDQIHAAVAYWSDRMRVKPSRVTLREMRRKWGSCSSKGHITLNTMLLTVPYELMEYIVVHELVHLMAFDHGNFFHALMRLYMPDYRQRADAIQKYLI
ncbi:MAG TPA: M48 family metallopeptidase [Aggregatilineales bacterium]|jgi:hypothetical protein|nr:M48 family metallopeptidase [Aggregatilineales bacterium]